MHSCPWRPPPSRWTSNDTLGLPLSPHSFAHPRSPAPRGRGGRARRGTNSRPSRLSLRSATTGICALFPVRRIFHNYRQRPRSHARARPCRRRPIQRCTGPHRRPQRPLRLGAGAGRRPRRRRRPCRRPRRAPRAVCRRGRGGARRRAQVALRVGPGPGPRRPAPRHPRGARGLIVADDSDPARGPWSVYPTRAIGSLSRARGCAAASWATVRPCSRIACRGGAGGTPGRASAGRPAPLRAAEWVSRAALRVPLPQRLFTRRRVGRVPGVARGSVKSRASDPSRRQRAGPTGPGSFRCGRCNPQLALVAADRASPGSAGGCHRRRHATRRASLTRCPGEALACPRLKLVGSAQQAECEHLNRPSAIGSETGQVRSALKQAKCDRR
jgi:hypothetical protein